MPKCKSLSSLFPLTLSVFLLIYAIKVGDIYQLGFFPSILSFLLFIGSVLLVSKSGYKPHFIDFVVFTYFIVLIFCSIYSVDRLVSFRYLVQISAYSIIPYFIIRFYKFDLVILDKVPTYLSAFSIPISLGIFFTLGKDGLFHNFRLGNDLLNPVAIGYIFAIISISSFYSALNTTSYQKYISIVCFFLAFTVTALAGSRTSLGGAFFICILLSLYSAKTSKLFIIGVLSVVIFGLYNAYNIIVKLGAEERFVNIMESASAVERQTQFSSALNFFYESPLFGLGLGGIESVYGSYPHNILLEHLANLGILGSLPFFVIILYSIYGLFYWDSYTPKITRFFLLILLFSISVRLLSFNMANTKEVFVFLALYINLKVNHFNE